jgi:hypothetical protein
MCLYVVENGRQSRTLCRFMCMSRVRVILSVSIASQKYFTSKRLPFMCLSCVILVICVFMSSRLSFCKDLTLILGVKESREPKVAHECRFVRTLKH